jgi:hypothetical protein
MECEKSELSNLKLKFLEKDERKDVRSKNKIENFVVKFNENRKVLKFC